MYHTIPYDTKYYHVLPYNTLHNRLGRVSRRTSAIIDSRRPTVGHGLEILNFLVFCIIISTCIMVCFNIRILKKLNKYLFTFYLRPFFLDKFLEFFRQNVFAISHQFNEIKPFLFHPTCYKFLLF